MNKLPIPVMQWMLRSPSRILRTTKLFFNYCASLKKIKSLGKEKNLTVPLLLIISSTARCNLSCAGCYSKHSSSEGEMSVADFDKLITQSKATGVFFYVIAGGEPFLRKDLFELYAKHKDVAFLIFTNGTLITEEYVEKIVKAGNAAVMLSIEGFEAETNQRRGEQVHKKVLEAMKILKKMDVFHGFSVTVSKANIDVMLDDKFFNEMVDGGCRMGTYVEYIPCNGLKELVLTSEDRLKLRAKILERKKHKKIMLFHLPEDENAFAGKCLSAGSGFMHINSQGYAEPCPFVNYASENIKQKSFKEILASPFLKAIREKEATLEPGSLGCGLFENLEEVKKIAEKCGAIDTAGSQSSRNSQNSQ